MILDDRQAAERLVAGSRCAVTVAVADLDSDWIEGMPVGVGRYHTSASSRAASSTGRSTVHSRLAGIRLIGHPGRVVPMEAIG